jgi:large subunit ribosomal protein L25
MSLTLHAVKRAKNTNDAVRADGKVPAVVYAPDIESMSIAVDAREFNRIYRDAGDSTIVELEIEGQKEVYSVLIQDTHMAPVKDEVLHIDFYKITAGQELSATIHLNIVGESQAVKLGGTLMAQRTSIDVSCLPKDLIDQLDVDISSLKNAGDVILISDLTIPAGITVSDDPTLLIATVAAQKDEAESEDDVVAASIDDIQVEEKGKKEEAEDNA